MWAKKKSLDASCSKILKIENKGLTTFPTREISATPFLKLSLFFPGTCDPKKILANNNIACKKNQTLFDFMLFFWSVGATQSQIGYTL
jgi:hypothetical protein